MEFVDATIIKRAVRDFLDESENQIIIGTELLVPSRLQISVLTESYKKIAEHLNPLQEKLGQYVVEYARERDFTLSEHPNIFIIESFNQGDAKLKISAVAPIGKIPDCGQPLHEAATPVRKLTLKIRGGEVITINKKSFQIGRRDDSDLVLPYKCVSSKHCTIESDGGDFFIMDHGSTNGTWLNGMRIVRKINIKNRDIMEIGDQIIDIVLSS